MTKQFNTLAIISIIITSSLTNNANGMMGRYLLTLAGDTCLIASAMTMLTKDMTPDDEKAFLEFGKPSQLSQIRTDVQKILPYAPLLIPGGIILSVGGRLGMLTKAPIKGTLLAGISIPINAALVASAYWIRMEQVPNNAGIVDKAKDKIHEELKRWQEKK
jgi:hypothetical protein